MKDEERLAIAETKWGQKELRGRLTSLKYLVIGQIVIVLVVSMVIIVVVLGKG
jgi:hypothetical protein|tara:strand:+ start:35 stop:193 length:159 start_codon:yes stop_codon:yes gene_type:complete